jgi:hypothetical protein
VAVLVPLIDATLPPALAFLMLAPGAGSTGQAFEKAATPSFRAVSFLKTSSDLERGRIVPVGQRLCQIRYYRDAIESGRADHRARRALAWGALQGHGT